MNLTKKQHKMTLNSQILISFVGRYIRDMEKTEKVNRLRVAMTDKNITNKWLAEQMGVSTIPVSRRRTNKIQPSLTQLVQLTRILNVDAPELLEVELKQHNE